MNGFEAFVCSSFSSWSKLFRLPLTVFNDWAALRADIWDRNANLARSYDKDASLSAPGNTFPSLMTLQSNPQIQEEIKQHRI